MEFTGVFVLDPSDGESYIGQETLRDRLLKRGIREGSILRINVDVIANPDEVPLLQIRPVRGWNY